MSAIQVQDRAESPFVEHGRTPRRRSRTWLWVVGAVGVAVAVGAMAIGRGGEPSIVYQTEPAAIGAIDQTVEGSATVTVADGEGAAVTTAVTGVVTAVDIEEGDVLVPMQPIVEIGGETQWLVAGPDPVFRDLRDGDEGADVTTLERSLDAAGYDVGEVDDLFDADTSAALSDWQADQELDETGIFAVASFVWAPADAEVLEIEVARGDVLAGPSAIAAVAPRSAWTVEATVDQESVTQVEVGQDVTVAFDGIDDDFAGSVTGIEPLVSGDGDYLVEIDLASTDGLRLGMEGTAEVVIDTRTDAVTIPTGALGGSVDAPTVDVLVDGVVETRSVQVGIVTPTRTEIAQGIGDGEDIVIGQETAEEAS